VQDAEQAALDDQRHAQQRDELLLVEQRIDRVTGLERADEDGLALRRDPAGEALADRHPEAGLDFLLEAASGTRHELVGLLVEKEDRRGVDHECLDDALEKHLQQPVELQVRKSRLGDPLEVAGQILRLGTGAAQMPGMVRELNRDSNGLRPLSPRSITAVM
jgi:hypothetical protein